MRIARIADSGLVHVWIEVLRQVVDTLYNMGIGDGPVEPDRRPSERTELSL